MSYFKRVFGYKMLPQNHRLKIKLNTIKVTHHVTANDRLAPPTTKVLFSFENTGARAHAHTHIHAKILTL